MLSISRSKMVVPLLAGLLPISYLLWWLFSNTQLPGNDAANYLMTAVSIYHHFTDQGFLHGLWSCYTERGWRPIFFPVLTVPFLLITQGNLYIAFSLASLSFLIATLIYVYLFFRIKLNQASAIIATNLIGLLPLIQAQFLMFFAEAALFPCLLGGVYHLIKSDYLRKSNHSWAVILLFSLAIMLRPIEAVTHLCFLLTYFIYCGCRKHYFSFKQILAVVGLGIVTLEIFFLAIAVKYIHIVPVDVTGDALINAKMQKIVFYGLSSLTFMTLMICLIIFIPFLSQLSRTIHRAIQRSKQDTMLVPVVFMICILSLWWFLPFSSGTFEWVFRTSFGDVASNTGALNGSSFSWHVLKIYMTAEGMLVIFGLAVISLVAIVNFSEKEKKSTLLSDPLLYLLLLIPFPLWEAFYTVQIAVRKLCIAFPAIIMSLLLISLQMSRYWKIRFISVCIITLIFYVFSFQSTVTDATTSLSLIASKAVGSFVPKPIRTNPNPHNVVMKFLNAEAKQYKLNSIALAVNPGTSDARHYLEAEPIDPFLLSTMILADKSSYAVSYPYFSIYTSDSIKSLHDRYDAIFVSDKKDDMQISKAAAANYKVRYTNEDNASLKVLNEILLHYASAQLDKLGWKVQHCIDITSIKNEQYTACILRKI